MRPVWFRSASEMACVAAAVSGNWTLNLNYWTGGVQQSCRGQWAWCSKDVPDPMLGADDFNWAPGQPDNPSEQCLHVRFYKNTTAPTISDRNCNSKFVLACQAYDAQVKTLNFFIFL